MNGWNVLRLLHNAVMMFVLGLATAGCGRPMEVESYWGPGLRFSETARSYDWAPEAQRTSGEGRPANPRVDELIRQSIEKHLALKGYEKVADGAPDFWVDYWAGRRVRGDARRTGEFTEFTEGTLAVHVLNPSNSKLIWRGIVRTAIDDAAPPDKRVARLEQAVKKMLDQVPSRKTGG